MPSKFNLKYDDLGAFIVGVISYFAVATVTSYNLVSWRRDMFSQWFFKDGCLSATAVLLCILLGLLWPILFVSALLRFGVPFIAGTFSGAISNIKNHETCCGVSTAGRWVEQQPSEEDNGAPDQVVDQPPQREAMLYQKVERDIAEAHTRV